MVSKSADELAKQANGNVEPKNLTEDGGMVRTYLYDGPLINHLNEGEQPHYVFSHINSGLKILDESGEEQKTLEYSEGLNGKTYLTITDSRIIYVSGIKGGDQSLEWDYSEIKSVNKSEEWKHSLDNLDSSIDNAEDASTILFATSDEVYAFAQQGDVDSTVDAAIDYVSGQVGKEESELAEEQNADELKFNTESEDTAEIITNLSNINVDNIINDSIPECITEIDDSIKQNETVYYAYLINAAERGDDNMGGLTTGGCLLATDRRLTAYVNETIGSSNLSIDYSKIDTVEIEHGAMITKLSVQSTSKTYSFPGFNNIGKSEIHDFADFIRDQASKSESDDTSESNVDPTEQLKNIKELHDQGVLTDEEFEEKKQSLLDKL